MRKWEQWIVKGNTVLTSGGPGVIMVVNECRLGGQPELTGIHGNPLRGAPHYLGERMVMRVYVQLEGVSQPWPMNPNEIRKVA